MNMRNAVTHMDQRLLFNTTVKHINCTTS